MDGLRLDGVWARIDMNTNNGCMEGRCIIGGGWIGNERRADKGWMDGVSMKNRKCLDGR